MEQQPEGMTPQKMSGKVLDKFLVDVFKPKNGNEKDIVVFTFLVNQKESATNLHRFISKGPFDLIDVEASPAPDEDGNYLVFVEMDRSRDMFGIMDDILQHIDYLVDVHHWQFRPYSHNTFIEWNRDNFIKTVPQNSAEYSGERPKSKFVDAGDTFTPSKELMESNQLLLRQFIDKQINRHSKTYIQSLQDQIHSVIQDNQRLLEHIEELKLEQQQLHQQLDSYQKREDMSLQRDEKIYSKIRDLENQVTRFAASNYQSSSDMNDTETVAESSNTFESIDSRQEVEELVSVAEIEEIENEADDDLDATSELQFDDDFEFESDLIEMEEQLHSDALSEEASGQKVEEQEEIENEVAIAPDVDELHSDESGVPLEPPGLSNEYFADENGRKEQSDTIDKGTDTIKSEDDSFTEYVHDDDFVADIDDEVGISEVSGEDEIEEIEPLSSQEEDDSLDTLLELESILESENAIKDTEILKINSEPEYASVEDQNGAIEQTDVPEDIDEDVHDLDTIVEVEDDARISATTEIPTDDDISQSELISHQEIEPDQEEVIHELETIVQEDEVSSGESEPILIEDALSEKRKCQRGRSSTGLHVG